jgi:hypothetical protein
MLLVASPGPAKTYYISFRNCQIPIGNVDEKKRQYIKEVLLYLAGPDGKSWQLYGRAGPEKEAFEFRAAEDGAYQFKMAVVDAATGTEDPKAEVRWIVVDTVKPLLRILSAERQGDEVLVRWDLVEKNPDYTTLKLEYRTSNSPDGLWSRANIAAPESGQARFHADGPVAAVRMSIVDLARNPSDVAELPVSTFGDTGVAAAGGATTGLPPITAESSPGPLPQPVADRPWSPTPPGGTVPTALTKGAGRSGSEAPESGGTARPAVVAAAGSDPVQQPPPRAARGPLPPAQLVRKRQVTIDYEVTKYGASGVKSVELYITRDDGRTWQRCDGEDNINVPMPHEGRGAGAAFKRSLTVELQADGLYGFYLVVKSGAGLGAPPPQNGIDAPQMRVEVDTTAPQGSLLQPLPHPTRRDSLILMWRATDNKLGPTPITLQWADRLDGEWQTIGGGELPNAGDMVGQVPEITGSYAWQVPANIPPHVYLRMLVRDQAGNECVAQTAQPILVDLNEPEVKPLQIRVGPR